MLLNPLSDVFLQPVYLIRTPGVRSDLSGFHFEYDRPVAFGRFSNVEQIAQPCCAIRKFRHKIEVASVTSWTCSLYTIGIDGWCTFSAWADSGSSSRMRI